MIITAKSNPTFKIFDANDNQIGYVCAYNTQTKEITMLIPACMGEVKTIYCLEKCGDNFRTAPKDVTFILEGSYATNILGEILV